MLDKINDQIKQAMIAKEDLRLSVLRQLKTALNNEAIAQKKKDQGLTDEESLKVVKREANKRKDAIRAYTEGGRAELAENEKNELVIIDEFLPEQLSEEEIGKAVIEIISETGAVGVSDFGKVMGASMKKLGTTADGDVVSKVVKDKLSNK